MHAANDLKNMMLEIERSGKFTHIHVSYIFGKLREILEANNKLKESCKILDLFCHWSVHTHIELSAIVYQTLERISLSLFDALSCTAAGSRDSEFSRVISNSLNFGELRNEIRDVFLQHKIKTSLLTNQSFWNSFLLNTAYNIRDKPLRYSESALKGEIKARADKSQIKSLKRIAQYKNSCDFGTMVSLSISPAEDDFVFGERRRGILIACKNKSGATFCVAAFIPS